MIVFVGQAHRLPSFFLGETKQKIAVDGPSESLAGGSTSLKAVPRSVAAGARMMLARRMGSGECQTATPQWL
jgi:hypothetical protein